MIADLAFAAVSLSGAGVQASVGQRLPLSALVSAEGSKVASTLRVGSRYRLAVATTGESLQVVKRLGPRGAPFDVDLGRDRRGDIVATYSRCRMQRPSSDSLGLPRQELAQACGIYEYNLHRGGERKLARAFTKNRSSFLPSRWGRWLTFVQRAPRAPGQRRRVELHLVDLVRRTDRVLPGGSVGSRNRFADLGAVRTLDLRGRRLVFSWTTPRDLCPFDSREFRTAATQTEIWTQTLTERGTLRSSSRLALGCTRSDQLPTSTSGAAVTSTGVAFATEGPGNQAAAYEATPGGVFALVRGDVSIRSFGIGAGVLSGIGETVNGSRLISVAVTTQGREPRRLEQRPQARRTPG